MDGSLKWMALIGFLNIAGAVAYASRVCNLIYSVLSKQFLTFEQVPERWYPFRYDTWGSSHQILHCMAISAGLAHMFGLPSAFDYLRTDDKPCDPCTTVD